VPQQAATSASAVRGTAAPAVILQPTPVQPAPVAGGNGSGEVFADGNGHTDRAEHAVRLEFAGVCPDCGETLVHENGCATCRACGFSKC
jgi:hypothetical protein